MIRTAIVGLGRWGQNLVHHVQGKSDKLRFVAGMLRHPANASEFAAKHDLKLYDNYEAVLRAADVDAVVLATPHSVHAEQIIAAARAGKHVYTEKPFTLSLKSAQEAVRACARNKVTLMVGYNWRFQPALQEVRNMLHDGRLGKLLHMEGNFCGPSVYWNAREHWRQRRKEGPAGGMTGRGVHVVDAMLYLAGPVAQVYAQSARRALNFGVDDTTSMLFKFRSGASGYLGTVIATAETWRMQIFGSNGWVEVGDIEHLPTWQMRVCLLDPKNMRERKRPQVVSFPDTSTERAELEHFADAASACKPLAVPGGEELHGVAVMDSILKSIASKKPQKVAASAGPKTKTARKKRNIKSI